MFQINLHHNIGKKIYDLVFTHIGAEHKRGFIISVFDLGMIATDDEYTDKYLPNNNNRKMAFTILLFLQPHARTGTYTLTYWRFG